MNKPAASYPFPRDGSLNRVNIVDCRLSARNMDAMGGEFSDAIKRDDARWTLATRVQLVFSTSRGITPHHCNEIERVATTLGISPMHASLIIGIVERAQLRGGLDAIAMEELLEVPQARSVTTNHKKARLIGFAVLCVWSILIALLMQLV